MEREKASQKYRWKDYKKLKERETENHRGALILIECYQMQLIVR